MWRIFMLSLTKIVFVLAALQSVAAEDSLGYTAILVIVILELVFAFSIGVGCVIFSFNLVRSVYASNENEQINTAGNFPKAKLSESLSNPTEEPLLDYNTFEESGHEPLLAPLPIAEEPNNQNRSIFAILKTFTDYIRIF